MRPVADCSFSRAKPTVGLAGAAFADQAERFALRDVEGDAVDGADLGHHPAQHAAADREADAEIAHLGCRFCCRGDGGGGAGWLGGQQHAGVGVGGVGEHGMGRALLDDAAVLHDGDVVCNPADHVEVVADQQEGEAAAGAFLGQEIEDAGLDGDVQRGGGLVGDQELGVVGESHGDHDALALAAAQLVREGLQAGDGIREADAGEEGGDGGLGGAGAVKGKRLAHLAADAVQRVQARHRLLKDHAGDAAPGAAEGGGAGQRHVLPVQHHAAGGLRAGGQQAQDGVGGERLAGAAFADHRQGLPGFQAERDVCGDGAAGEGDGEAVDLQQGH